MKSERGRVGCFGLPLAYSAFFPFFFFFFFSSLSLSPYPLNQSVGSDQICHQDGLSIRMQCCGVGKRPKFRRRRSNKTTSIINMRLRTMGYRYRRCCRCGRRSCPQAPRLAVDGRFWVLSEEVHSASAGGWTLGLVGGLWVVWAYGIMALVWHGAWGMGMGMGTGNLPDPAARLSVAVHHLRTTVPCRSSRG